MEPAGSTYHDPETGDEINSGTQAIIKAPGEPDFREFAMAVHDFAFLFDKEDNPLNPPSVPGLPDDPGVMGINYKNEPLQFREGDPAYVFSSYVHGDPVTPLLEAYEGDPVRIRPFDGAHEERHSFNMNGLRWHQEPDDKLSPLRSQQTIGISEAFNLYINEDYQAGDYLYYFGGEDDLWLGLWGVFRAYDQKADHLQPLDDRPAPPERTEPLPQKTGEAPAKAQLPEPPEGVTTRKYEVSAIQADIVYNGSGDHDPNGLLFVMKGQEDAVRSGKTPAEPLTIRVNAGEVVELTLTNHFTEPLVQTLHPGVPVIAGYPPSDRVSLHAALVCYDPTHSDGATVGFNPDQTVGPGESITYRWYADQELGACLLTDMGDMYNHRGHGLWGGLIIEPEGSVPFDVKTGKPLGNVSAQSAIIRTDAGAFREFALFMQDGIDMYDKNGKPVPDAVDTAHGGMDDGTEMNCTCGSCPCGSCACTSGGQCANADCNCMQKRNCPCAFCACEQSGGQCVNPDCNCSVEKTLD